MSIDLATALRGERRERAFRRNLDEAVAEGLLESYRVKATGLTKTPSYGRGPDRAEVFVRLFFSPTASTLLAITDLAPHKPTLKQPSPSFSLHDLSKCCGRTFVTVLTSRCSGCLERARQHDFTLTSITDAGDGAGGLYLGRENLADYFARRQDPLTAVLQTDVFAELLVAQYELLGGKGGETDYLSSDDDFYDDLPF